MSHTHIPLAEKAAALRESVLATEAPCWLPDAAHALILSLFARIFARLEDMIALWAQGLLPPPSATPARKPNSARPLSPRHPSRATARWTEADAWSGGEQSLPAPSLSPRLPVPLQSSAAARMPTIRNGPRTPGRPPAMRLPRLRIWWSRNRGARATFTLPRPPRDPACDQRAPPRRHSA